MFFDVKELIYNTRSYRAFDESVRVREEDLLELVDGARLTGAAMNAQVLKYRLVTVPAEVEGMIGQVRWASKLSVSLPPEGHHPGAFLVICHDTTVAEEKPLFKIDVGIAAEAILLGATEIGLGGCCFASFDAEKLKNYLRLPEALSPQLVIALGRPAETVLITALPESGDTSYFRDSSGTHFVPKRSLEDVIVR